MNCPEMRIIMRYRKLGNTGLWVSELGFGTIPILSGSVPVLPDYYNPDLNKAISDVIFMTPQFLRNMAMRNINLADLQIRLAETRLLLPTKQGFLMEMRFTTPSFNPVRTLERSLIFTLCIK